MGFEKKWKNPGRNSEYDGLYLTWMHILQRAGNKDGQHPTYADVSVCERWQSYDNFFEDMSDTWYKGATIDKDSIKPGNRIYCPEYCKWVSRSENSKEAINRNGNPMRNPEVSVKFSGGNNGMSRCVKCIETDEVFESCRDADRKYSLPVRAVCRAANPKHPQKTAGGYHWKYIEE